MYICYAHNIYIYTLYALIFSLSLSLSFLFFFPSFYLFAHGQDLRGFRVFASTNREDAWPPDRLYAAFWSLAQPYGPESLRELFAGTARRAYRM